MQSALLNFFKKIFRADGNFKTIELPPPEERGSGFPFWEVVPGPVEEDQFDRLVSQELLRILEESGVPRPVPVAAGNQYYTGESPYLADNEIRRVTTVVAVELRRRREVAFQLGEHEEGGRLERLLARVTVVVNSWTRNRFC